MQGLKDWVIHVQFNLISPGFVLGRVAQGGRGAAPAPPPPSDLGRGSRDRRENLHKGRVRCKLQDCIVRLFFIIIFYFIWINYANLGNKFYFHYKSLIKASRLPIFGNCKSGNSRGTLIFCGFRANSASTNSKTRKNICDILYAYFGHVGVVYWPCVLMHMGNILESVWDLLCFCAAQLHTYL